MDDCPPYESVSQMKLVITHVRNTKLSNALYMYDGSVAEQYVASDELKEILAAIEKNAK